MLDEMHIRPYDEWANSASPAVIEYTCPVVDDVPVEPISQALSPVVPIATVQRSHEEQLARPSDTPDKFVAIVIRTPLETSDDPILIVIVEIKELGFETIDNRHKSETLNVIGGKELEQPLYAYRSQGFAFSRMMNGNKSTDFRPAWYSKTNKRY